MAGNGTRVCTIHLYGEERHRVDIRSGCTYEYDQVDELQNQLSLALQAVRARSLGQVHELRLQDLAVVTTERDKARRQVAELRDKAELMVMACLDLLPVEGSWNRGYKVSESVSGRVNALPEEWATAAHHLCELHDALARSSSGGGR